MANTNKEFDKLLGAAYLPMFLACFIILIKIIELLLQFDFRFLGNRPRTIEGLIGIIGMPFVHGSFSHVMSNAVPLIVLGTAVFYFYNKVADKVWLILWILSGLMVWLMARGNNHIGASGIVYGLASFLFISGIARKDVQSTSVALIVAFFYGSLVWGVIPGLKGISWEGHLFGAISGLLCAYWFRKIDLPPKKEWNEETKPYEYWRDYVNKED